jgi:hypothetical protein
MGGSAIYGSTPRQGPDLFNRPALLTDLLLLSILFKSVRSGLTAPPGLQRTCRLAALAATNTPLGIANSMFAGITSASARLLDSPDDGLTRRVPRASTSESLRVLSCAGRRSSPAPLPYRQALWFWRSTVTPNVQLGLMISLSLIVCRNAAFRSHLALLGKSNVCVKPAGSTSTQSQ